ncbi:amidohydrolase 2 [Lepidopterella palustris CBS 459.81]|uniref:Amidohydrolase 2 n=1 Tax=Lepidopterella palustris CBS 459.81 TaxID=1314670 RepID=A0A8E2JFA5_9PEZI|nr:amidohydrolase 2 [Lepidopterella palustris CBS 459.81]
MRSGGISLQVISHVPVNSNPNTCRKANDALHASISVNPIRYAAFALLPLSDPKEAATELVRCISKLRFVGAFINHRHEGEYLDADQFRPILAAAEQFSAPLYIRPSFPTPANIARYRGNYSESITLSLSTFDFGWSSDTALCILRLFAARLFDRYAKIKIIIGQMGQMLPFIFDHLLDVTQKWTEKPKRDFKDVWFTNIWVTTSGMFSLAPMACLINTIPADRILFSVGYPFSENIKGKKFLEDLKASGLVTQAELEDIVFKNAETLLGLRAQK